MPNPIAYLCPGQGAQALGMGKAWFDASPDAARTFGAADEILEPIINAKLSDICFNGPAETLNRTDIAQPALYTAAIASYQAMSSNGAPLAATAGLSLGEYTALHIAGAISFQDGLTLVAKRGRAMQDAAEASDSSMVALIGADEQQADELCAKVENELDSEILVPANYNAPGQIVISGTSAACKKSLEVAEQMNLRATQLSVAGAFHSPIMAPAAEQLADALRSTPFNEPSIPVYSNVTALPHAHASATDIHEHARSLIAPDSNPTDQLNFADTVRARLLEQLTAPVKWAQSCSNLIKFVADTNADTELHELAPGKVLSGLMRRIDRQAKVTNHDAP